MFPQDEFKKYAIKHKGISSLNLHLVSNSYEFTVISLGYHRRTPTECSNHGRFPV